MPWSGCRKNKATQRILSSPPHFPPWSAGWAGGYTAWPGETAGGCEIGCTRDVPELHWGSKCSQSVKFPKCKNPSNFKYCLDMVNVEKWTRVDQWDTQRSRKQVLRLLEKAVTQWPPFHTLRPPIQKRETTDAKHSPVQKCKSRSLKDNHFTIKRRLSSAKVDGADPPLSCLGFTVRTQDVERPPPSQRSLSQFRPWGQMGLLRWGPDLSWWQPMTQTYSLLPTK